MPMSVGKEIAALKRMTVTQLRVRHVELFGERTRSGHKDYPVKQIAWRLQAEGDLSERARRRAEELANDADLRSNAPRVKCDDGRASQQWGLHLPCASATTSSCCHSMWINHISRPANRWRMPSAS